MKTSVKLVLMLILAIIEFERYFRTFQNSIVIRKIATEIKNPVHTDSIHI